MGLIERKQAEAEGLDQAILRALAHLSGPSSGSELAALVDRPERTVRRSLARLEEARFVARQGERGGFVITAAGRDRALGEIPGAASGEQLDTLLALLPTTAHRAFVRLGLAAIAGRHLLHAQHPGSWPAFVAMGATGHGKSLSGEILVRAFGVDENLAMPDTSALSPGEIFGRRLIPRGSQEMTFIPSPRLGLPILVLNEWDKDEEIRRESKKLVLGRSRQTVEGVLVESRPLVVITMNVQPENLDKLLPRELLRRAVVLDTRAVMVRALVEQLDDRAEEILAQASRLRYSIKALRLPPSAEPHEIGTNLRRWVRSGLTDQGREFVQFEALERIVIGRAALLQTNDYRQAAAVVALDFLHTRSTLGLTTPDYWAALYDELGGDHRLLVEAKASQAELESARHRREDKAAKTRVGLVREKATRRARIIAAREPLRQTRDGLKAATRDVLTEYARKVKGSSTAEALEEHWEVVEPYLVQAEGWINADKQSAERDGRQKERERLRSQDQAASRKAARQAPADQRRRTAQARKAQQARERQDKDDASRAERALKVWTTDWTRVTKMVTPKPKRRPGRPRKRR